MQLQLMVRGINVSQMRVRASMQRTDPKCLQINVDFFFLHYCTQNRFLLNHNNAILLKVTYVVMIPFLLEQLHLDP